MRLGISKSRLLAGAMVIVASVALARLGMMLSALEGPSPAHPADLLANLQLIPLLCAPLLPGILNP